MANSNSEDDMDKASSDTAPCGAIPESMEWRKCDKAAIVVLAVMFSMTCLFSTFDVLTPYDSWSDVSTLMAGENFAKYGFLRLHFEPVHYLASLSETPVYYLHYPPLPEIFNGLLQSMGIKSLFAMRIVSGLFFLAGLFLLYRALGCISSPLAALCGITFLGTSAYFIAYSTSIHTHAYNTFFLGAYLCLFIRLMDKRLQGGKPWILCWLILFVASLTSFEFILYMQVFSWMYVLAAGKLRKYWLILMCLGLAPVTGVTLRVIQNLWAAGWHFAASDALGVVKYHPGLGIERLAATIKIPSIVSRYSAMLFHLTWPCFALLTVLICFIRKSISRRMEQYCGPFLLAVLAASASWYLFLPTHASLHLHTANQLLVLVVFVMGCTFSVGLRLITCRKSGFVIRILVALVLLAVLLEHGYEIKNFLSRKPGNPYRVARVVGPDALPRNASYLCSPEFRGPYTSYFLKRALWDCSLDALRNEHFLQTRQEATSQDEPIRYFLFYHEGDYLKDELFIKLASSSYGKQKLFQGPAPNTSCCLILFDISEMITPHVPTETLPDHVASEQLKGLFPQWEIPGFEERFVCEFAERTF
jgi:hypothetical protein